MTDERERQDEQDPLDPSLDDTEERQRLRLDQASASRAGLPHGEDPGIGSTDGMTASTGGMAGTSR